ncbi:MAG TPA: DegT/DnrJ/EryC1/StrS family aminotransferase [Limnochordales bacterium]
MGLAKDAQGIGQGETPFFDAVRAYRDQGIVPFHTPGHKQGRGAPGEWAAELGAGALGLDVSDVLAAPRWDDSWTAVLAAAEGLAAQALGADFCHFLVNGTTAGVHAMLLAVAAGGKVIVARNSHRSVIGGLILADAWPVYVEPVHDPATGLWLPPPAAAWIRAMDEHPDASAILVTYPTYDGAALDLGALAQAAAARGIAVLVDEAHGPHFGLHPALPPRAIHAGADMSAQSPHKLLGSLTQASWLLGRTSRVAPDKVAAVLDIIQTTSPSALLLASLDVARRQVALDGQRLVARALTRAEAVRAHVAGLPGLTCLPAAGAGKQLGLRWDPTKVLLGVTDLGISGYAAARFLRRWGVQVELAGPGYILALITWSDNEETVGALCHALTRLVREAPQLARAGESPQGPMRWPAAAPLAPHPPPGRQRVRPRAAALAPAWQVPLDRAVGAVAADMVCPYPPGIPVWCPGEEVSEEAVAYLQDILRQGGEVRGLVWAAGRPNVRVADPGGR